MYKAFVKHLQQDDDNTTEKPLKAYTDLVHIDNKLKIKVEFIWAPYVSKKMITSFRQWQLLPDPPSVIVVGTALYPIRASNGSRAMLEEYQVNLTRLVQPIDCLSEKRTHVLWAIQEPVNYDKLKLEYQMITNELIDSYNKAAIEVLSHSNVNLWWSLRLVGQGMITESNDGIHLARKSLRHDTQILLNMYCNDYMNFNDGTCCSSTESHTTLQIVTFVILAIW